MVSMIPHIWPSRNSISNCPFKKAFSPSVHIRCRKLSFRLVRKVRFRSLSCQWVLIRIILTLWSYSCQINFNIHWCTTIHFTLNTLSILASDPGLSSLENLIVAGVGGSYWYHRISANIKASVPKTMVTNANGTTIGAMSTDPWSIVK